MALPAAAGRDWDAGCSVLFALALQLGAVTYMHLGFVPNEAEQRQQQPRDTWYEWLRWVMDLRCFPKQLDTVQRRSVTRARCCRLLLGAVAL